MTDPLWLFGAPLLAMVFLVLTTGLLIWDLEHPGRFHYILLRPQWRSWLVRGGVVLTGFGAVLAAHLGAAWAEPPGSPACWPWPEDRWPR